MAYRRSACFEHPGLSSPGFTAYDTFAAQLLVATVIPAAATVAVHALPRASALARHVTVGVAGAAAGLFPGVWLATAGAAWGGAMAPTTGRAVGAGDLDTPVGPLRSAIGASGAAW